MLKVKILEAKYDVKLEFLWGSMDILWNCTMTIEKRLQIYREETIMNKLDIEYTMLNFNLSCRI